MTTERKTNIIGWNVDTQYDFMRPDGKLYVHDAEKIEPNLRRVTSALRSKFIPIVHTADWHTESSPEISNTPDFKTTYPPHCMMDTGGAVHVMATRPKNNVTVLEWQQADVDLRYMPREGTLFEWYVDDALKKPGPEFLLYKDDFDVFKGTRFAEALVEQLKPKHAIVYGVATNVCVNYAVEGLRARNIAVVVIDDAVKELPPEHAQIPLEQIIKRWSELGVKHLRTQDLLNHDDATLKERVENAPIYGGNL